MKKLISLFMLSLMAVGISSAQTDIKADFSMACSSGQVLYYKIVDYGEVNVCYHFDNPEMLGGFIVIPRAVKHEGQNYVVTGIADDAFANCIRIQGVELPTTMFYIGNRSFMQCTDLRVIQMPKTLVAIGERAFEGDTSLIDVVMPNAVVEMGAFAFKNCTNVRHFVISHGLTEIPEGCFQNCRSVTDYFIPANVITLGCDAFEGYEHLRSVTFFGNVPPMPQCEGELPVGREIPIYVTRQGFDAYKASYIWGQHIINAM